MAVEDSTTFPLNLSNYLKLSKWFEDVLGKSLEAARLSISMACDKFNSLEYCRM